MTEDDTELETSRAFDRGNYAAAYESEECNVPEGYRPHERTAYLLGFYSSCELYEIHDEEHRFEVEQARGDE